MTPEFSRPFDLRQIGNDPVALTATPEEREALARRFGLVSVGNLEATLTLDPEGPVVNARGRLKADWVQPCAISGEDLAQQADEPIAFRFVPEGQPHAPDEEIELTEGDCDEIEYAGTSFDLGEAVAQSLALAIDPFATGPDADRARQESGILEEGSSGPFAALAGLKLKKD